MDRWEDFSVDVQSYRVKLQSYRDQLEEFCNQLDENRHRICETVRLYEFFDKVRHQLQRGECKKLAWTHSSRLFMKGVKYSACTNRGLDLWPAKAPSRTCVWSHFFSSQYVEEGVGVYSGKSVSLKNRGLLLSELYLADPSCGCSGQNNHGSTGQKIGYLCPVLATRVVR